MQTAALLDSNAIPPNAETLSADHDRLSPSEDVAVARRYVDAYAPRDARQQTLRRRLLSFMAVYPQEAHLRSCRPGHLTASALVIARDSGQVLLMQHRKLQRWLQLGGHCDGDADLAAVALREACEESGLDDLAVLPHVVDIDIHPIPARGDVPEHLHYDTRFLVFAPTALPPVCNDESDGLRWLDVDEAHALTDDDSVRRLLPWARLDWA